MHGVKCATNGEQFICEISSCRINSQPVLWNGGDEMDFIFFLSFSETWAIKPFVLDLTNQQNMNLVRCTWDGFRCKDSPLTPYVKSDAFICSPTSNVLTTRPTKTKSRLLLQSRDVTNRFAICPLEAFRLKNTRRFLVAIDSSIPLERTKCTYLRQYLSVFVKVNG